MSRPNPDRRTRLNERRAQMRFIDGDPFCGNCGYYMSQHVKVRHAGEGRRLQCLFAPTVFTHKRKELR